ncbi:MAG: undecaprenyl-diphosphate phosphatase [Planctomycetota bacterium]
MLQVAEAAAQPVGTLHAIVLGLVEGLTEFLPVSSTGHLIVANSWLGRSDPAMEVAMQAGAITAIVVLYWRRLLGALTTLRRPQPGRTNLLWLLFVAALPAAVVGILCDDWIEVHLFSVRTVAWALMVGGIALWILERWYAQRPNAAAIPLELMTLKHAFAIGLCQCLALIPGTSRSAATIAGGLVLGYGRTAAAEFSFLVGLPILYGASALKLVHDRERLTGPLLGDFLVACAVSFVTALAVVVPFVAFLRRHTFVPFAVYRVAFGALLLLLLGRGTIAG